MDSDSSHQMPNPKRLKTLASEVRYDKGNNILHQFVLDNSDPNHSVSQNCINAVLVAMNGCGVHVNAPNNDRYSPLHLAVLKNNLLMVQKLLSCLVNIDVNARRDEYGETALILAVESGHLPIIRELLNKGADPNIKDGYQDASLYYAIRSGNLGIVKLLVSKGANVERINGERGALHCAAGSGNLEMVKYILSNGADVNAEDKDHKTPLYYAVQSDNLESIKFLVDKGANVNAIDRYGQTPLHHLLDPFCVNETDNESDNEPDKINIDLMKIKLLLEANADVNIKDEFERTPLWCAVHYANSDIVKLLLEKEVYLNDKRISGDTLLPLACKCDDKLDIIEMLLAQGCDVNAKNKCGETPLQAAVRSNHADYTQLLLERGASVRVADIYGWTPLHWAACCGHVEVVRVLLDKGADKDAVDKDGKTPLDLAEEENHQLCMDALQ